MNSTPGAGEVWSVSRLVQELKSLLVSGLPSLWIEGEVSNFVRSAAGHRYFTLKDETNQLKCALFRGRSRELSFEPADGMKAIAFGRVDLYGPRSEVQMLVEQLHPAGLGSLELAFRELHRKLKSEGLFEASKKRALPLFPQRIGVISSARGAALRDILHVLHRRCPHVQVVVADTAVQGEAAPAQMVAALDLFNRVSDLDVLIVARGGGSLEDLWAFNDESVVRAVRASRWPVISGVGHEIDTTLTDLAADLRAATPSAAAEIVARPRSEWYIDLSLQKDRMRSHVEHLHLTQTRKLASLADRYGLRRPEEALRTFTQKVDDLVERLGKGVPSLLRDFRLSLLALARDPAQLAPTELLERSRGRWKQADSHLKGSWVPHLASFRERLAKNSGSLTALSPRSVLDRGFAVLLDLDGRVISSIQDAGVKSEVAAVLKDGRIRTLVQSKERDRKWP